MEYPFLSAGLNSCRLPNGLIYLLISCQARKCIVQLLDAWPAQL